MNKINNNSYNYNTSFKSINEDKSKMQEKESSMGNLVSKTREFLADRTEKEIPENGLFRKIFVAFDVPNTNNEAMLVLEMDGEEPRTQRRLSVGVHHKNADRLTSNYLLKGTKEEIISYLNDSSNQQDIINLVNDLSQKTDDYYSSL